ncbi:STIP1 y and U box-containing protein 1 [Nowakowskiella sp. JEL0407]|nr:STIP1 y and U box-containing protein 1 [Nowakowskiella sp. JEL0407]
MSRSADSAEAHKRQGNVFFEQGRYNDAIKEYSTAVIQFPKAVYFTNRALCYLKLKQYDRVIADTEKAIELDENSVKGHYFMGQALMECDRYMEATAHLKRAHLLAIEQQISFSEEIANAYRRAKKKRWEAVDKRRRENESDLYRYITGLVEKDRRRQLEQLPDNEMREDVSFQMDQRIAQIESLFMTVGDTQAQKREVPDYLLGKISFEYMIDPVITPSGITYDRGEIMHHLRKIGETDPISRKPLHERDLIPNLAMKEVLDDYLDKNGWAIDY